MHDTQSILPWMIECLAYNVDAYILRVSFCSCHTVLVKQLSYFIPYVNVNYPIVYIGYTLF